MCRNLVALVLVLVAFDPSEARAEVRDKIWTEGDLGWLLLIGVLLGLLFAATASRWPVPVLILPCIGVWFGAAFIEEMFYSDIADEIERERGPAYLRMGWAVGITWTAGLAVSWLYGAHRWRRRRMRRKVELARLSSPGENADSPPVEARR